MEEKTEWKFIAVGMAKCYLLFYSEGKEERKEQENKDSFNLDQTEKKKNI